MISISDQYYGSSVEKVESFLLECQKDICVGKFWVALQANVLSDQTRTSDDFDER